MVMYYSNGADFSIVVTTQQPYIYKFGYFAVWDGYK